MTTVTIVMKVRPEKLEEFLQLLLSLNDDSKKQQGLRKSALHQHVDDQSGFTLIYEWETNEEHEKYLCTEKFRVFLEALKVLM